MTARIEREPQRTLPIVIDELAAQFGEAPALLSDRGTLSFKALAARMNAVARWALAQNLDGKTVGLLMTNQPDYLTIWLGITRAGGSVALLNTNLRGAPLSHCIAIAESRHIIVSASLHEGLEAALGQAKLAAQVWIHETDLDVALKSFATTPLPAAEHPGPRLSDRALCIYTSGTTGPPKAANISHRRIMTWSYWFAGILNTSANDRMMNCLPMYHSVGGIVAIGSVLVSGGAVVLQEKFSVHRFWDDVVRWDCTLFQYIGELCRYLLKVPENPHERAHRLRLACGNGLRADVWRPFQERFRIPHIIEFYAATEGTFSLINVEGEPGAIGRVPPFLAHRFPSAIVKFDVTHGEPLRDENGFCIPSAAGEAGEAIGQIAARDTTGARFEGYTSAADSEAKVLRNVFAEGDAWFRTGDLMRKDARGFYYFVDRIGDTFRWKGENVSTFEVAEALAACPGVVEATAYGVLVPGADGRAGMAALVLDAAFDLAAFHAHVQEHLPPYARPLFLRICETIETTETFKQKRAQLARDGFNPTEIRDVLYFDTGDAYVPLDASLFAHIAAGKLRL
ncbi:long-chain-acyl-CoA synthetase [Methylovirgula ligni]|uniref:long-chain-acyl-CoA synthetase n=1 Tax=Methylovirgula ligni TaxID=569860 RepID=UPI001FDF70C6|nr:long-chain-acyl-CoA synthetase [Methylovirgula ligni]